MSLGTTKILGSIIVLLIFTSAISLRSLHNAFADSGLQILEGTANPSLSLPETLD
jgi:hypothetical protein